MPEIENIVLNYIWLALVVLAVAIGGWNFAAGRGVERDVPAGLLGDLAGVIASVIICRAVF